MPAVRRVPMPEGGAEQRVYYFVNHNCTVARALKNSTDCDDNIDLVLFPVGHFGMGIPAGRPFEVETTEPCGACGKVLRAIYEWVAPRIWTP